MLDLNNYETADMVQKGHTIILPLYCIYFQVFLLSRRFYAKIFG